MFWHPHGITLANSKIILNMTAIRVSTAQAIPTLPILTVIFSNFYYSNVGSYSN